MVPGTWAYNPELEPQNPSINQKKFVK